MVTSAATKLAAPFLIFDFICVWAAKSNFSQGQGAIPTHHGWPEVERQGGNLDHGMEYPLPWTAADRTRTMPQHDDWSGYAGGQSNAGARGEQPCSVLLVRSSATSPLQHRWPPLDAASACCRSTDSLTLQHDQRHLPLIFAGVRL